jgi:hypothetical protein
MSLPGLTNLQPEPDVVVEPSPASLLLDGRAVCGNTARLALEEEPHPR